MMSVYVNDRLGLISTVLKAVVGLDPSTIHQIFSTSKKCLIVTIFPTRMRLCAYGVLDAFVKYPDKVFINWWDNILNWRKYSENLNEELIEAIECSELNDDVIENHTALEVLSWLVMMMHKGSQLKEVVIRFVDKSRIVFTFQHGYMHYTLTLTLKE